jgi:hypothetical protein
MAVVAVVVFVQTSTLAGVGAGDAVRIGFSSFNSAVQ